MQGWQGQDDKAKFSEVAQRARNDGLREITEHGEPRIEVLPKTECERLVKPLPPLVELFRSSPLKEWDSESDLCLERDDSPTRDVRR
ncbi:Antitoxin Phd_YefM, type II toxin-antitoxin system [Desulfonatronum zhilinae]|nr:Antitoxin Phd_YefM, type II toxin-antitoxin system [Desulfonatronum zhilinae]